MNTIVALVASVLLASGPALAADPAPAPRPASKAEPAKPSANAAKSDTRSASGVVNVAQGSQQNRMRECNKSATGKKGAERKAFMKSCLSTRKE
ncbi:MAG: PsiF family protein [Casimicrobiaceae bacterium]